MPSSPDRPIFIVGTERSGSNLLRLVLNSHSRIFIPHPPHIMHLMRRLEPSYGDLRRDERFLDLAADVCALVRSHTFPWEIRLDPHEVAAAARGRDLFGIYAAVHELYLRHSGKARWGCKSTFMINETAAILREYPRAQFIHLVRDPRDVAVSARSSVFNHFHPWFVARLWTREQSLARGLHERLPADQIMRLHYEDLVADPAARLAEVCEFLGEPFEPAMLTFFDTEEARRSASLCQDWRNTGSGFMQGNTRKFLRHLRRDEIAMVEAVAEPEMRWLSYPLMTEAAERRAKRNPAIFHRLLYLFNERAHKLRAEILSLLKDRNYPLRVRKWLLLRWLAVKAGLRRGRARLFRNVRA